MSEAFPCLGVRVPAGPDGSQPQAPGRGPTPPLPQGAVRLQVFMAPGKVGEERGAPFPKEAAGWGPGHTPSTRPAPPRGAPHFPGRPSPYCAAVGALEVNPGLGFEVKIHFLTCAPWFCAVTRIGLDPALGEQVGGGGGQEGP